MALHLIDMKSYKTMKASAKAKAVSSAQVMPSSGEQIHGLFATSCLASLTQNELRGAPGKIPTALL